MNFNNHKHTPSVPTILRTHPEFKQIIDFCVPVNLYFSTPEFKNKIRERLEEALKYYPSANEDIARCLGEFLNLPSENLVLGNGSNELITWIDHLLIKDNLLVDIPTFGRWTDQPAETGKNICYYQREIQNDFQLEVKEFINLLIINKLKVAVISNPNNPTGAFLKKTEMLALIESIKSKTLLDYIIIDESFIDFADDNTDQSLAEYAITHPGLIVLKSLGKSLGMHGIRLGYSISHTKTAAHLRKHIPKWNINGIAECILREMVGYTLEFKTSLTKSITDRDYLIKEFSSLKQFRIFPSSANFIYVLLLTQKYNGTQLQKYLLENHKMLIRECGSKIGSSSQFLRIASRTKEDTNQLISALTKLDK